MLNVYYEWAKDEKSPDMLAKDKSRLFIWASDDEVEAVRELLDDTKCVAHSEAVSGKYEVYYVVHLSRRTEEKDRERLLESLDNMNDPNPE